MNTVKTISIIIVKAKLNFNDLVLEVRTILGHSDFTRYYVQQQRMHVKSLEGHGSVMSDLKENKIGCHMLARETKN